MEEEWENIDLKEKEGAVSGGRDLDLSLFQDDKDEIGKTVTAVLKDANGHLNGNENGKHADHAWLCLERDDSGNMILSLLEDKKTKKKRKSNGDEDCKNDENDDDGFGEWEVLDCKSEEVFLLDDEIKARSLDKLDRAQSIALGLSGASAVAMTGMSTTILGTMVLLAATDLLKLGYKGIEPTSRNKSEIIQKVVCKSCVLGAISCGTSAVVGSAIVSASKLYIYVPAMTEACMTGAVCSVGSELMERKASEESDLRLRKEKNMVKAALWGAVTSGAGGILKPLGSSTLVQHYLEQGTVMMEAYLK